MKIKNEYVIINNGKKQIKLHNTILNTYIEKIISNQLTTDTEERATLSMIYMYLKFDEPLIFDNTTNLQENDFDLRISRYTYNEDVSPKQIIINNFYKADSSSYSIYEISTSQFIEDLSNYIGRKITAIGFGGELSGEALLYACVDTYNYNIYLETFDEVLSVIRRDILSTDTIFYSPNKKNKGPIHLSDGKCHYDNGDLDYQLVGILDSIGLGLNTYKMDVVVSLIPYNEHVEIEDNILKILDELTIEYYSDGLFPLLDLYPSTDLYPARIIREPLYPSNSIYPEIDLYMLESPFQYVQLKYKIYKLDIQNETIEDTGDYYLLSTKIQQKKKIKMNIKYEEA